MLLIGSAALKYWCDKALIPFRTPKDYDIITTEHQLNLIGLSFEGKDQIKVGNIEYIDVNLLNNKDITIRRPGITVANPIVLYLIKRSHTHRPLNFTKNINDLSVLKQVIKESNSFETPYELDPFYIDRVRLTKEKFGDKTPSLNKSNKEFFDDFVTKYFDHDDLHKLVAYTTPIYEKLKNDQSKALCEKDLWISLPFEEKLKCVAEECMVIALERFIIPKIISGESHMPGKFAFDKALEKVCTTLTSGWFRDFAIDNYWFVRDVQYDFVSRFLEKKECLKMI